MAKSNAEKLDILEDVIFDAHYRCIETSGVATEEELAEYQGWAKLQGAALELKTLLKQRK